MTPGDIDHLFTFHPPSGNQPERYGALRETARSLAHVINDNCPEGADKSAAIRKLRECIMTANAAIALEQWP